MTNEEKKIAELTREVSWEKGQKEEIYREFLNLREELMQLSGEHAALEKAFNALEEEKKALEENCRTLKETLVRERRRFAQGDSMRYLKWKHVDVKGEEMILITGHASGAENLVIPEQIEGCRVLGVEEDAFSSCDTLLSVDLPYGMRAIAERAFANCPNLQNVRIPKSVVWMGEDSFSGSAQANITCAKGSYAQWFAEFHNHTKTIVDDQE